MDTSGSGNHPNLKSLEEIPEDFREIFREYKSFNAVQSKCFDDVFHSEKHIVLGAPTSSGKTGIFEIAIVRLLHETQKQNLPLGHFRMVYVAPIKALCKERFQDWERKFSKIGVKCKEATGDNEINDIGDLEDAHLILTTPEKWDSLTRKWRENRTFVESIKLFMVDEIHLLNEPKRGPTLEAIISRMKTIYDVTRISRGEDISRKSENQLRFVAVSATIPNISDLAEWLGHGYEDNIKYFAISEDMRPVKLKKVVLGYNCPPNMTSFRFDMTLNYQLVDVIHRFSNGKPTLVFCSTRRGVEMASSVLVNDYRYPFSAEQHQNITQLAAEISDQKLKTAISKGIAFHHAGLAACDRTLVENGFRQGQIPVLLCTSTLAMGINLPAHLVIIKSTQTYQPGVEEISQNSILQMIGRAGRPQFDESGVAVIMTQQNKQLIYERLVCGTNPIESHLHKCLAEHLNSEIVLQTITDLSIAVQWIKSTFFYVRACKSPMKYGISAAEDCREKKLEEMCMIAINALERHKLIEKNEECVIMSTQFGRLMARYYINFDTIKLFGQLAGDATIQDILNLLTKSAEFVDFKLRNSDKRTLNDLNRSKDRETIRFKIKGRVTTVPAKISCLMQAILGNLSINDSSLSQEATKIVQQGERLTKCLFDYLVIKEKEENSGNFGVLWNAATIAKCFEAKLWEDSKYVTKQFKKIGPQMASTLANSDFSTIESVLKADPRNIEVIVNKAPPFGNDVRSEALRFPSYELKLNLLDESKARVTVFQHNKSCDANLKQKITLFVGDNRNNLIFYRDDLKFHSMEGHDIFQNTITFDPTSEFIVCKLIHKTLVGIDKSTTLKMKQIEIETPVKSPKKPRKSNKITDHFKKKKKIMLDNSEYNPEETINVDSEIIETENYDELFHNDEVLVHKATNSEDSVVSRYEIVEIMEPETSGEQFPNSTISDDTILTVSEGELMIEPTPMEVETAPKSNFDEKSVTNKSFVYKKPVEKIKVPLLDHLIAKNVPLKVQKISLNQPKMTIQSKNLPKPALTPAFMSFEEKEVPKKSFTDETLALDSSIERDLRQISASHPVTYESSFISAKSQLKKDLDSLILSAQVPQKSDVMNNSYINSFFAGQYCTPVSKKLRAPQIFGIRNLSQLRKEARIDSPEVILATDSIKSIPKEQSTKLDVVDFEDFMNDVTFSPKKTPQIRLGETAKRRLDTENLDDSYFSKVLTQMCDDPKSSKVVFDPSETWKSFENDLELVEEQENDEIEEKSVDETHIREQMKQLEACYVDPKPPIIPSVVEKSPTIELTLSPVLETSLLDRSDLMELLKSPSPVKKSSSNIDLLGNFRKFMNEGMPQDVLTSFSAPLKPSNNFKQPALPKNKTLGIRWDRPRSILSEKKENTQPLQYYLPSLTLTHKYPSTAPSKINPLKMRQSHFHQMPARMGSLNYVIDTFKDSIQSMGSKPDKPANSTYIYPRPKSRCNSENDIINLEMFKNVTAKSFMETVTPQVKPKILPKPQFDVMSQYQQTILMQRSQKRAAPSTSSASQDFSWMQPQTKKPKYDEFFDEKFFDD